MIRDELIFHARPACPAIRNKMAVEIKIYNASDNPLPRYESKSAAGMDIRAFLDAPMVLKPHRVYRVPTGLYIEIPQGYEAQIRARSGLAYKHGITLVNGIGTIDADYRGEIGIIVMNLLEEDFTIHPGERIAQMVIAEVPEVHMTEVKSVDALDSTERGEGGFGHTGR